MFNLAIPFPDISPFALEFPAFIAFGNEIGPIGIRWYALGYIVGIIIAWNILLKLSKCPKAWGTENAPFNAENIDDFIFYATIGIIIGGRLGYVFLYAPEMLQTPGSILKTWEGGMSFHGGILGVTIATILVALNKKLSLLSLADGVALASPLGIGLVRVTNFINQELYGRPTDVPWAFIFKTDPYGLPRHPSQLYEAFFEGFLLFAILYILVRKFNSLTKKGLTAGVFLTIYAIARITIENFREPDNIAQVSEFITRGMAYSLPILLLGLYLIFNSLKNRKPS